MSRRLSSGLALQGAQENGTGSSMARRASRKSFGTALPAGAASAQQAAVSAANLSSMYQTVLKMSAENKISAKNSWQLPLIDHMEKVIRGDMQSKQNSAPSAAAKVKAPSPFNNDEDNLLATADAAMLNFQRASCTLDASIKIWACRVDDVWSSSYRVLENLSRGGEAPVGEGDDEDGQGGEGGDKENGPGKAKKAAKAGASLLSVATGNTSASATIEKNLSSITSKRVEAGLDIDPMFHKLQGGRGANGADEGGAGATLMLRLPLQAGCALSFGSDAGSDASGDPDAAGSSAGWGYDPAQLLQAVEAQAAGGPPAARVVGCLPQADSQAVLSTLLAKAPSALALGLAMCAVERASGGPQDPLALPAADLLDALTSPATTVAPSLAGLYTSMRAFACLLGEQSIVDALSMTGSGAAPDLPVPAVATLPVAGAGASSDEGQDQAEAPKPSGPATGWEAVQVLATQAAPVPGPSADEDELPAGLLEVQAKVGAALGALAPSQEEAGPEDSGPAWLPGAGLDDNDMGGQNDDYGPSTGQDDARQGQGQKEDKWLSGPAAEYGVDLMALQAAGGPSSQPGLGGHWKFRAAAKKAAVLAQSDAAKASGAAEAEGEQTGAGTKKKGGKGKGKGAGINFNPTAVPPATVFAKAKTSLLARAMAAKSKGKDKDGVPKDGEQISAAKMAKMAKAGPEANLLVPASQPWHPITLRPLGRHELPEAMVMAHRPALALQPRAGKAGQGPAGEEDDGAEAMAGGVAPAAGLLFGARGPALSASAANGAAGLGAPLLPGAGADDDEEGDADGGTFFGWGGAMGGQDVEYGDGPGAGTDGSGAPEGGAAASSAGPSAPGSVAPSLAEGGQAGLSLVSKGRQVEKVSVRYETVSKRVDVHALKTDMAQLLGLEPGHPDPLPLPQLAHKAVEGRLKALARAGEDSWNDVSGVAEGQEDEEDGLAGRGTGKDRSGLAPSAPHPARATLSSAIGELAPALSNQVTVPFYFITLLHLANEHGLALMTKTAAAAAGPQGGQPLDNLDIALLQGNHKGK